MSAGSDNFAAAPAAALNAVTDAFSNVGYTIEAGEQNPGTDPASEWFGGGSGFFTRSAWWRLDAGTSQAVQVHAQRSAYLIPTGYQADVLVSVFQGATLGSLILVARGSLGASGGVGDTPDYTPWVANWAAVAGVTYFIQLSSIYDEDINYRLTMVPTPIAPIGDWNDGGPVEIGITNPTHSSLGVSSSVDPAADFDSAAATVWSGTGTLGHNIAAGRLYLQDAMSGSTHHYLGAYGVGWWRYDVLWPSSVSYTHTIPDDEAALPAHTSVEWEAVPAGPGSDWRLRINISGSRERGVSGVSTTDTASDVLATVKLGAYDLGGAPGDTYDPGFKTPSDMSALSTLGTGYPFGTPVSAPITTGVDSVAFGVIDPYSLSETHEAIAVGDAWEVDVWASSAQILATVVPQYRYTYTAAPVTVGPVPMVITGQIDKTRVRPYVG